MANFFAGAGGALIGGALSGISNLFGAHSQNKTVEKQLAAAREEAEKRASGKLPNAKLKMIGTTTFGRLIIGITLPQLFRLV